jgi:hypothetical protein
MKNQQRQHRIETLRAWVAVGIALFVTAACGPSPEHTESNVGAVCIGSTAETSGAEVHLIDPGPIEPGAPLQVIVTNGPPPEACTDGEIRESCSVTVDEENRVIEIESEWYWYDTLPNTCNLIASSQGWTAQCEIPATTEGSYTVKHGARELGQLQVPSESRQEFDADEAYDCGLTKTFLAPII